MGPCTTVVVIQVGIAGTINTTASSITSASNYNVTLVGSAGTLSLGNSSTAGGKALSLTDSGHTINVTGTLSGAGTATLAAALNGKVFF